MKRLAFLLAACLLCMAQTSTTLNVDIVVTHGAAFRTTFTFKNLSGGTLAAGTPISFGQGFAYNDIPAGTHPLIQDPSTHTALAGQQWDDIDTWTENGGNGSWRFAVWGIWLPSSLANGATYQIEIVDTAGTYSETSHQALSALCSGPAAHDLKIHLTNVVNQDYSQRDSGDATFRVCDNIANTGRDAPRHLRAGNVYDEYEVSGLFVYATSGNKDPLLYTQCILDIFTQASDSVSAGDVRWVCHVHNSWINVAAGNTGNAGNPGPAGFTNDPQAVTYRMEIDDGSTDVLDWSGLDATIASSSNPIQPSNNGSCDVFMGSFCMKVPSSTGPNAWYSGQPAWVTCTGTCVAGATPNTLVYMLSSGASQSSGTDTTWVGMATNPGNVILSDPGFFMTGSQGTGTTTFSQRFQHYKFETMQTLDWSGQDNWAPIGTTTRVTRKVYPAFTPTEKTYWESTGLVIPISLSQTPAVDINWHQGLGINYEPFGKGPVQGTTGVGGRPDLGIVSEYAAQAFVTGAEKDWDIARNFTLGSSIHGFSTLIDEASGRIPVLNNGPPGGPGGNGQGGSYPQLGAPQNQITWGGGLFGIANINNTPAPPATINPAGGTYVGGTYLSHMPSFDGIAYAIFGDRWMLDLIYWNANRDFLQQRPGPGDPGQGYYRDNNAVFTDGNTYHYWGLVFDCCEARGAAWMRRDVTYGATYGPDGTPERQMFGNFLSETGIYYPLWQRYVDGTTSTTANNYTDSISSPDWPGAPGTEESSVFIMSYIGAGDYDLVAMLHSPLGAIMSGIDQRRMEATMGGRSPGALPPSYNVYYYNPLAVHNGACNLAASFHRIANLGQCFNGVDASDFALIDGNATFGAGGLVTNNLHDMSAGGTAKSMGVWAGSFQIDQMPGNRWFNVIGPFSNGGRSFFVQCNDADHAAFPAQCPVANGPFVDLTSGGVSVAGQSTSEGFGLRPLLDPGPGTGFTNGNYAPYAYQNIGLLKVSGYKVDASLSRFLAQAGFVPCNPSTPSLCVDPNVVVPGLPTAMNLLP